MENQQELIRIALRSKRINNVLEDYELLASICYCVSPQNADVKLRDAIFDTPSTATSNLEDLLSVGNKCEGIWTLREGVDWLLFYIFYRRYGWDDWQEATDSVNVFTPSIVQRVRTASREEELRFKDRIVSVSSSLIAWFEKEPLLLASLKMVNSALRIAKCAQNTRQHMTTHALRWLTSKLTPVTSKLGLTRRMSLMPQRLSTMQSSPYLPEDATPETMFFAVKDFIVICMTDSSFTTRSTCIPLVAKLLEQLSLNTSLRLIDQIIEMCSGQVTDSWEAIEGLLNFLGLLIKRTVSTSECDNLKQDSFSAFGLPVVTQPTSMSPEIYVNQIYPKIQLITFHLFDHHHSSVRIGAVNLFITCLKRCPQSVVESALEEVMSELSVKKEQGTLDELQENGPLLGLNATESLLSLCQLLLRYAGSVRLPPSTGGLQNSLLKRYLCHSNNNIRMAACQVYVTLILGALDNQNRVRYLLGKILENWPINQEILLSPLCKSQSVIKGKKLVGVAPSTVNPGALTNSREASLSIFYLVAHTLVQRHYAMLYNILVRGLNGPQTEGELGSLDDATPTNNNLANRYQRTSTMKPSSPGVRHGSDSRRSIDIRRLSFFDENLIQSPRSQSLGSGTDQSPTSPKNLGNLLAGLTTKKINPNTMSVLDRLRVADDTEKLKILDVQRTSLWKSGIARRLSIASGKRASLTLGTPVDPSQTKLRLLLVSMMHAACENLLAESRDLRQCARKTFPEVVRLLCWFDSDVAVEFVQTNLTNPPSMMSYAALKILRSAFDQFGQYEKFVISGEDFNPGEGSSSPDARGSSSLFLDTLPDGYFLNVSLIRQMFKLENSTKWLSVFQNYLSEEAIPTFIALPTLDCTMGVLSLADRFPQFNQAANFTNSLKPSIGSTGEKADGIQLTVDANKLVETVCAAVKYLERFEVVLNDEHRPTTVNGEHLRITALRPFPIRQLDEQTSSSTQYTIDAKLVPFLTRIIHSLEKVLFYFLPPVSNPERPDPALRRCAGILLCPCLLKLATWPMALLPPGESDSQSASQHEIRLLAVRKLLRIIASIVHALSPDSIIVPKSTDDQISVPEQMEVLVCGSVDVTSTANAYFTQLEKILTQLVEACEPIPLCDTSSWWWFRALCEHLPKLMQIAPRANCVSLLRSLLDIAGKSSGNRVSKKAPKDKPTSKLWKRALTYAKTEAVKNRTVPETSTELINSWATTVGQLLEGTQQIKERDPVKAPSPDKTKSVGFILPEDPKDEKPEMEETMWANEQNPAFDYISDEGEQLVLEPTEPDSSSSEEFALTVDTKQRANIVQVPRRRKRYSSAHIKAEPIETPPPKQDIVGLIQRVWVHCEPITVRTLQNLLSGAELSLITGDLETNTQHNRPRGK